MKLIINKFLPISQKCTIDLSKKLTLFVGKNNSGKTYLSQLIWAINAFDLREDKYYTFESIEPILFFNRDSIGVQKTFSIQISNETLLKVAQNYTKYIVKQKVSEVFKKKVDLDIEILFKLEDFKNKSIEKSGIKGSGWTLLFHKRKNAYKFNIELQLEENFMSNEIENFPYEVINRYLEGVIIESLLQHNPVYMPSTRLFLPSFYKYILTLEKEFKDDMFDNFDKLNEENKSFFASSYTQAIDDLIKKLIFSIDKPNSINQYLQQLVELIEGDISVDKSENIGMADISYTHKSGKKLPMYLSSSMVNQLVTVYLYFKYWYQKDNNFLLLDEPEMNLHPSKKIELMEILLDFASQNKLLMATHSSTMAKSIINYIHLFDLKEKLQDKESLDLFVKENNLQLNTNIDLVSNDIAIYYFNGKTIVPYKKEDESHIHFGTFTEIEKLQSKQYEYLLEELESDS